MKTYRITVITAAGIREAMTNKHSGVREWCDSWHHDTDVYCHTERVKMFDQAYSDPIHEIEAWDDDEAVHLAACLVTAEYGDDALANVQMVVVAGGERLAWPVAMLLGAESIDQEDWLTWR